MSWLLIAEGLLGELSEDLLGGLSEDCLRGPSENFLGGPSEDFLEGLSEDFFGVVAGDFFDGLASDFFGGLAPDFFAELEVTLAGVAEAFFGGSVFLVLFLVVEFPAAGFVLVLAAGGAYTERYTIVPTSSRTRSAARPFQV